jgi:CheY-like chemotaxis protein
MKLLELLLVEDERDIQFIVKLALEKSGRFAVTCFENGEDAISFLSGTGRQIDLIIVNMILPGMRGVEVIERLRDMPGRENLPAIVISAALTSRDCERYRAADIVGMVAKPFDATTLAQRILDLYRTKAD